MDRKIDAAAILVAGASLLLVVSLFLDWFGLGGGSAITAWEAFEVLDLVLLAAAAAAVAAAFGRLDSRVLLVAALVAVVAVVSQLIQPPPAGQDAEREVGAWLALASVALLMAGAALVAAKIAVTVDVSGRERRRRVATVDKRAAAATPSASVGGSGPAVPVRDEPAPGEQPTTVATDRFAPEAPAPPAPGASEAEEPAPGGAVRFDPQATQAFAPPPPPDDPAR